MDYEKLKGKTVKLNNREVEIETIREIEGIHSNTYEINSSYTYSSEAIFAAIIEVEAKEISGKKLSFFEKLKMRFGIFTYKIIFNNELRFGSPLVFRKYGYHKCSIFLELSLGSRAYVLEFVFRDKNLYKSGVFPRGNIDLKKIF